MNKRQPSKPVAQPQFVPLHLVPGKIEEILRQRIPGPTKMSDGWSLDTLMAARSTR